MAQSSASPGNSERNAETFVYVRADRIVEIHVRRLADVADVALLQAQVGEAVARVGPRGVICGDHRLASPLPGEVADAWSRAIGYKRRNPMRGGLLLDPSKTMYNAQIARVVRCAGNPACRLFVSIDELRAWVGEELTESERAALQDLFSITCM